MNMNVIPLAQPARANSRAASFFSQTPGKTGSQVGACDRTRTIPYVNPTADQNRTMAHQFTTSYLEDSLSLFRMYKRLGEGAMAQLSDEQLFSAIDQESNSVAIIVKHMAGNMRSRWTDFLTTDGEKPDRNRDTEFENAPPTREQLMNLWEDGWSRVFSALTPLTDADLGRTITIRGEPHSVMQAVNRQVAHYAMHTGQIVFLAKHFKNTDWKTLSVPKKGSADFNRRVLAGEASQR
jgi:hypothetical protein